MVSVVVKAVHDTDLVDVLKRLGLYEGVVGGRYRCFVCGRPITVDNLGGMFKSKDGRINLVCSDVKCLVAAAEITARLSGSAVRE
ncbi:hypothetical protein ODS41_06195 [Pyrobaculum sp. 3827-6]|uniref:hypothetical protein n=1 Tax=Pyrobaculum sp. 3827-6 TaxID=2983604 RepID=UPI0021D9B1D6|nr:hypothetical protein [Pyrobaculum sp. 3827-6]MCU7787505.1 hypothetical protein [Pyrobaculum sp. 3827-6]